MSAIPDTFDWNGRHWRKCGLVAMEKGRTYVMAVPLDEWQAGYSPAAGQPGILLPRILLLPEGWKA